MRKFTALIILLFLAQTVTPAFCNEIRLFIEETNTTGVQNSEGMKRTIQTLLASRMSSDKVAVVATSAESDTLIGSTYTLIGKIFSLDAVAKGADGKVLARAFVQGESDDDLIPAIGKLAEKLSTELIKSTFETQMAKTTVKPAVISGRSDLITNGQIIKADTGDFIKKSTPTSDSLPTGWISARLNGAANIFALGRKLNDMSREVILAEEHRLTYYHLGSELKLIAEATIGGSEKIISLDTLEREGGNLDIYVTAINSGELASQVWQIKDGKLALSVKNLPYYFRTMRLEGGEKKLYVQGMGRDEDFYGDAAEANITGSTITTTSRIKMPRYGNIYSFNKFKGKDGNVFTTVLNPDGYLIVYNRSLDEIWRSNDKYGGSELYFQKDNNMNARITGDSSRWIFMNQRIQVTGKGEILVGKNDGFWILGNSRSYKSGAVYNMFWNGSSLEEKWRTRETQNYMPDFYFDEPSNELLILQTVQRPGFKTEGASSLTIKKVE